MKVLAIVALGTLMLPAGGATAPAFAAQAPACTIEGWSIDPDPSGLRVRAGPSRSARELGRLPAFVRDDDGDYGPIFSITAARDGWLRIADARDSFRPTDLPRRTIYKGVGWVHGSRVRLGVQSGTGYASPARDAPRRVDLGQSWLTDHGRIDGVLDCSGSWVKAAYAVTDRTLVRGPRSGIAWFTATCGDQRTTCDLPDAPRHRR